MNSYLIQRLALLGAAMFLTQSGAQNLGRPDLSVTKVCVVNAPQSVLCTVTIKNIGQVPSVSPLTLTDTPTAPAGSTYTGAGSNTGLPVSCSLGAGPVLPIPCTASKSMQPGESADVLFSFKVPSGGQFKNCVSVSQGSNAATPSDPNPANNTNICTTVDVPGGGGPITIVTPPPTGACTNQVVVSGLHYPSQSCTQSTPDFVAGLMTSFHFTSKCPAGTALLGVINASCQNAPIPGFPTGSIYQGTACCGTVTPPTGRIKIVKEVSLPSPNPLTSVPGPFTVQVSCSPSGPSPTVTLTSPNYTHWLTNVPAGSSCKIEEVPPKAPPGCQWTTTYPNGQSGKPGDTLVVRNELKCEGGCPAGQTETVFPGTDAKYCCDGKPGSDKFCCTRKK